MLIIPLDQTIEVGSCLYRLSCGSKYIIIKAKSLEGSVFIIQKGYTRFISDGAGAWSKTKGEGKNNFYYKLFKFVHDNPSLSISLSVILESENGYQLLKNEQIQLNAVIKDPNCLNTNIYAYIPKYNPKTGMYGWISRAAVLNFKKFLKRM